MRLRRTRGSQGNRKAIGAVVITGVLVVAGVSGLQYANASERTAADLIVVNGEQFDVAGCDEVQVNDDMVLCDGEMLQAEEQGAGEAADLAAAALTDSCDAFAAAQGVVQEEQAAEDDAAGKNGKNDKAGQKAEKAADKAEKAEEKAAKKAAKAGEKAARADARADAKAAREGAKGAKRSAKSGMDDQNAEQAGDAGQVDEQAVADAEQALQDACLALSEAKGGAAAEDEDEDEQAAEDEQADEAEASPAAKSARN